MQSYTYIIIGASAAGISALNKLWQLDPSASVACISDQMVQPYNTCFLVDHVLDAKSIEQITLRIVHQKVDFILGKKVIAIDREKKSIILSDNSEILFQKLLLATGTRATFPLIPGIDASGVFNFHRLDDVHNMLAWIRAKMVRKAIVIGAGLTGLECADVLHQRGIAVTMVEKSMQVLSAHLPSAGAEVIQNMLEQKGVQLLLNQRIDRIEHDTNGVRAIKLANGSVIETDLVICTTGVQPNSELAHQSGLAMYGSHIAVNEYMQTSDSNIFVAGDVACVNNRITDVFIWAQAVQQGTIAAYAMTGNLQPYAPEISLINSHFFGLTFAQGTFYGGHTNQLYEQKKDGEFLQVALDRDRIIGFQFVGVQSNMLMRVRRAMLTKQSIQRFLLGSAGSC